MSFRNYLFSKNVSGGLYLNENNLDKIEKYALRIRKEIGDITNELDDKARKFRTTYLEVFDKMFSIYGISSGLIEDKPKEKEIPCPVCGIGHLVHRQSKKGESFWGCSRFTKGCKATLSEEKMAAYLESLNNNPINQDKD